MVAVVVVVVDALVAVGAVAMIVVVSGGGCNPRPACAPSPRSLPVSKRPQWISNHTSTVQVCVHVARNLCSRADVGWMSFKVSENESFAWCVGDPKPLPKVFNFRRLAAEAKVMGGCGQADQRWRADGAVSDTLLDRIMCMRG